jgi:hypothetical protein
LILETTDDRNKAVNWIGKAPVGTRVEFKASKRTLPQNDLLWALLTEFAQQYSHNGIKYEPSQWKAIFLHAFGREVSFLPSLDGKTFLPIEMSSSDLSKQEMTDFIEFIIKEAAERGVILHNPKDTDSGSSPEPDDAEEAAQPSPQEPAEASSSPSAGSLTPQGWLVAVSKMLWAATNHGGDIAVLKAQKIAAITSFSTPMDRRFVDKAEGVYGYCKQVVLKEMSKADGLAMVAGVVGCDQDEIGRV